MEPVQLWTGRAACALQAALRMTNESFAAHLGTAVRTVATWHQKPDRVPSAEMQQALDTTFERAGEGPKHGSRERGKPWELRGQQLIAQCVRLRG
jgi:8-oxo-dGTP diphosphatase